MSIRKKIKYLSLVILTFFGIFSCKKVSNAPSWDVDVLAPIIKSSIGINNILKDTLLQSNADSTLKLVYNTQLLAFSADTLVKVPDTTLSKFFKSPFFFNFTYTPGTHLIGPTNEEIVFDLKSIDLLAADLKTMDISFDVTNKIAAVIVFKYSIPCATFGGVPYVLFDSVNAAVGAVPGTYHKDISLAGYHVDLTGFNTTSKNTFSTTIDSYISKVASNTVVKPTDSLIINIDTKNIKPYYAKGYLGQTTVTEGPSQTTFSLFKGVKSGLLTLNNAKLDLTLVNNFGVDARLKFTSISSTNSSTANTVVMTGSEINKTININRATETGISSDPVLPTTQTKSFNNTNSNIQTLISNMPDQLNYTFQLNINPNGNVSGSNDFLYTDYGISTKLNLEVPLDINAKDIVLIDTVKTDISSITGSKNINSGELDLVVKNTFPFGAAIQLYLLDGSLTKVDSLMVPPTNLITGADVDVNGKVIQAISTKLVIPVTKEKIELITNTKKILIVAKFNTTNQPLTVKIYDYYTLEFKLIADLNYTLDFK